WSPDHVSDHTPRGLAARPRRDTQLGALAALPPADRRGRALLRRRANAGPLRPAASARPHLFAPEPAVHHLDAQGLPLRDPAGDRGGGLHRWCRPLDGVPARPAAARLAWSVRGRGERLPVHVAPAPARAGPPTPPER